MVLLTFRELPYERDREASQQSRIGKPLKETNQCPSLRLYLTRKRRPVLDTGISLRTTLSVWVKILAFRSAYPAVRLDDKPPGWWGKGVILNKVLYGEAPSQGPTPYSFKTEVAWK